MKRILLVDDEAPARARMLRMLAKFSEVSVVGEAVNGIDALEKIAALSPDILFLDIDMPELDGFGVAESIGTGGPAIVFVTAYDQYALKAFDVAAADYLVKPVLESRLEATIKKLVAQSGPAKSEVARHARSPDSPRRLAIRCGQKFVVFDPSKVSAIIARDHYAGIVVESRELLADENLESVAERLDASLFFRVHRSALINLEFLKELEREGDRKYIAVLSDTMKTRLPVARERLDELKVRLGI